MFYSNSLCNGNNGMASHVGFRVCFNAMEAQNDSRSFVWLDDIPRDLVYGIRTLRRTPAFTVVAMPERGIGDQEGRDLAAFLYTLR